MNARSFVLVFSFVALLVAADRGAGFVLSKACERLQTGAQVGLANYAIRQIDKEIVIFGSSRAVYHIDPDVLSSELGLSAFNAGSPGQSIRYMRAIESLLLGRGSQARIFVLHVNPKNLWGANPARLQRLAPFYGQDPVVDALLDANSETARFKLQVHTYRYNSLVMPMLGNLLVRRPSPGNGFRRMPAGRPQNLTPTLESPEPGAIHEDMSQLYIDFIEAAHARGIRVALVDGPRWRPAGPRPVDRIGLPHLAELARSHGADWIQIDEFSHPIFRDSAYFADVAHLTPEGAEIFSGLLAERLRATVLALPPRSTPGRDPAAP